MATITYTVTVATGTTQYGTGDKFYINGELAPVLYLDEGNTYIFDQTDSSNSGDVFAFSTNPNNSPSSAYTTGVTTTGTPGTDGKTTIVVAPVKKTGAPVLFYYCTNHAGMGNSAQTISPTSNEAEFNPQIDEIIEEAFERTGVQGTRTGYQLRSARRSLNIMFQEWGNRGLHYWELKQTNIDLIENQVEYHFFRSAADDTSDSNRAQATTNQVASTIFGMDDILEATYRTNRTQSTQQDTAMTKIDRSTYSALANKLTTGQPTQYYVQRFIDRVTVSVYPVPDSTAASADMHIYYVKRIDDVGDFTNVGDVPYRFVPCMVSGLAYYLAQKEKPEFVQQLKLLYEDELNRALVEDGSSTSTHITPKAYYPNV